MKQYAILDVTNEATTGITVVCEADSRKEAMEALRSKAVMGCEYVEIKTLGLKITPKEKKLTFLSRVKADGAVVTAEYEEPVEEDK